MCFSAAECISICFLSVPVGQHVGSKWSRARSDEVGMCGHAFNELRTRPQLKERGRKVAVDKERGERKVRRQLSGIFASLV